MTALPIVETMAGDISAYIPTNVISITDGQIYLESELFHAGVRPAVNVGLSVSRVGRSAQHEAMKKVSGSMRLDVAQYREMAVFAQFGSDIDSSTKQMLDRGERLVELTKQPQDSILSLAEQVAILIAYQKGIFSEVPTHQVTEHKNALLEFLAKACGRLMARINEVGAFSQEEREELEQAIAQFGAQTEAKPDAEHQ